LIPISLWEINFLKCQATVITGFQFSSRMSSSPYFLPLCFTTSISSCSFAATVCFFLAVSTRFLQLPERSVDCYSFCCRSNAVSVFCASYDLHRTAVVTQPCGFCITVQTTQSININLSIDIHRFLRTIETFNLL